MHTELTPRQQALVELLALPDEPLPEQHPRRAHALTQEGREDRHAQQVVLFQRYLVVRAFLLGDTDASDRRTG